MGTGKIQGCRGDGISIPMPTPYPYPWGSPYPRQAWENWNVKIHSRSSLVASMLLDATARRQRHVWLVKLNTKQVAVAPSVRLADLHGRRAHNRTDRRPATPADGCRSREALNKLRRRRAERPYWDVSYIFIVLSVETIRTLRAEGCGPPGGANLASRVTNGIAVICR